MVRRLSLLAVGGREAQQVALPHFYLVALKQLHVPGNQLPGRVQSDFPLLIAHGDRVAVAVHGQNILVAIAPFHHHACRPGLRFIKLMAGVGDFIEYRNRDGGVPQLTTLMQLPVDTGVHRLAVSVQLRDDERPGTRLGGAPRPVTHNIVHRGFRFMECTLGRGRIHFAGHAVSRLRLNAFQGGIDTVVDNVVNPSSIFWLLSMFSGLTFSRQ